MKQKSIGKHMEYRQTSIEKVLSAPELEMLTSALGAYQLALRSPLLRQERTALVRQNIVHDAIKFTKKAPWHWSGDEVFEWIGNLVFSGIELSTQRKYLSTVNSFIRFIAMNPEINNSIRNEFGVKVIYEA